MAMNGVMLGTNIANLIASSDADAESKAQIIKLWTDISTEILTHITQNAVITVAAGISVTTAGTAVAQTGATTSPGTATIV